MAGGGHKIADLVIEVRFFAGALAFFNFNNMVVQRLQSRDGGRDVGFFRRVESQEATDAQSQGIQVGRQEMDSVLNGEIMAGVPIDQKFVGGPLEREYLVGFWTGVSERIGDLLKTGGMSEAQVRSWGSVMQTVEGRIRDARGDTARIDMGDVQDEINRLMNEAQKADTMRLAA